MNNDEILLIPVMLDSLWGFSDHYGNNIIPCDYDEIENFSAYYLINPHLSISTKNDSLFLINSKGEQINQLLFSSYTDTMPELKIQIKSIHI
jgi:hypothetical protein